MSFSLRTTAAKPGTALLDLPWDKPLGRRPGSIAAALLQGTSRHAMRFVHLNGCILAVKEIDNSAVRREYQMLCMFRRFDTPCIGPVAVITGKVIRLDHPLNSAFVSEHLPYSLPYRTLFGQYQRSETVDRLIWVLSVPLVRLHLLGFFWGDILLPNALLRRNVGESAAHLIGTKTGEVYGGITQDKRLYDIDVARTNIIGRFMDLQAAGHLSEDYDTIDIRNRLVIQYTTLWGTLAGETTFLTGKERWVSEHVKRLNELGFDVDGLQIVADEDGWRIRIQPKVVDAGHFSRKIIRPTGMDIQEDQARRPIQDIKQYRVAANKSVSLPTAAHGWITNVLELMIDTMPHELKGKLEPVELLHQFLDHRWYISEQAGRDIPMDGAVTSFIDNVLRYQRDEHSYIVVSGVMSITSTSPIIDDSPIVGDSPITGNSTPSMKSGDEDKLDNGSGEDKYDS